MGLNEREAAAHRRAMGETLDRAYAEMGPRGFLIRMYEFAERHEEWLRTERPTGSETMLDLLETQRKEDILELNS